MLETNQCTDFAALIGLDRGWDRGAPSGLVQFISDPDHPQIQRSTSVGRWEQIAGSVCGNVQAEPACPTNRCAQKARGKSGFDSRPGSRGSIVGIGSCTSQQ